MKRWRWWATFALVQTVATFVLLEIVLHFYSPLPFRVRGDRIVLPVNRQYTFSNHGPKLERVVHHTRNSLGFRGPEPPRDLRSRLSIITIGGSTTECLLLNDGKSWTDVMAARLAPSFPGVWVNNGGIDGHSTYGHLILLEQLIVPLHPTVVVFLVGANDIGLTQPMPNDTKLVVKMPAWRRLLAAAIRYSEVLGIVQNLWRFVDAKRQGLPHREIDLTTAPRVEYTPEQMDAIVAAHRPMIGPYRQRLDAIVDLTRRAGIEPVFMTQPSMYGDAVDVDTGVSLATLEVSARANAALEWRLLELNNDMTRTVARERGVLLIDLDKEIPKDSRLYYDFIHYTNEGAVKVGDVVASHLAPFLRARFSERVPRPE